MTPTLFSTSTSLRRTALAISVLLPLLHVGSAHGQDTPASAADVNRDGVVSQAEVEYSTTLRLTFDDLDRNRDGRLDPTEISGLAPAPPGAMPSLPESAIGRPAGTVTPGSGTAGVAASSSTVPGSVGAARANSYAVPGSAIGTPPAASSIPGSSIGPASGSPFASPYSAPTQQGTAQGAAQGSAGDR